MSVISLYACFIEWSLTLSMKERDVLQAGRTFWVPGVFIQACLVKVVKCKYKVCVGVGGCVKGEVIYAGIVLQQGTCGPV